MFIAMLFILAKVWKQTKYPMMEEEENSAIWDNMNGTWRRYAQWNKLHRESQILTLSLKCGILKKKKMNS